MGVYSNEPDPPDYYQAAQTSDCVKYTDLTQAQWFMDRIAYAFGGYGSVNVRMAEDGTTIRWFGYYYLPLGSWLYNGTTPLTDAELYLSVLRPTERQWPFDSPPVIQSTGV